MIIKLSPQQRHDSLVVYKSGTVLTLNGIDYDMLSSPESVWIAGDVEVSEDSIVVTLMLPIPEDYTEEQAFPSDLVDVPDGLVNLPTNRS